MLMCAAFAAENTGTRSIAAAPTSNEIATDGSRVVEARLGVGQHQHHVDKRRAAIFHAVGCRSRYTSLLHRRVNAVWKEEVETVRFCGSEAALA